VKFLPKNIATDVIGGAVSTGVPFQPAAGFLQVTTEAADTFTTGHEQHQQQ